MLFDTLSLCWRAMALVNYLGRICSLLCSHSRVHAWIVILLRFVFSIHSSQLFLVFSSTQLFVLVFRCLPFPRMFIAILIPSSHLTYIYQQVFVILCRFVLFNMFAFIRLVVMFVLFFNSLSLSLPPIKCSVSRNVTGIFDVTMNSEHFLPV